MWLPLEIVWSKWNFSSKLHVHPWWWSIRHNLLWWAESTLSSGIGFRWCTRINSCSFACPCISTWYRFLSEVSTISHHTFTLLSSSPHPSVWTHTSTIPAITVEVIPFNASITSNLPLPLMFFSSHLHPCVWTQTSISSAITVEVIPFNASISSSVVFPFKAGTTSTAPLPFTFLSGSPYLCVWT